MNSLLNDKEIPLEQQKLDLYIYAFIGGNGCYNEMKDFNLCDAKLPNSFIVPNMCVEKSTKFLECFYEIKKNLNEICGEEFRQAKLDINNTKQLELLQTCWNKRKIHKQFIIMKMTSKLKRIDFEDRSPFETTKIVNNYHDLGLSPEEQKVFDSLSEYDKVIYPWTQHYSKKNGKNYFYNSKTQQSLWELPEEIKKKAELYYQVKVDHKVKLKQKNFEKFIGSTIFNTKHPFKNDWKEKFARVQKENTDKQEVAYEEGDEEYNIWYDKKIQDEIIPQRQGVQTKCNPFNDCGKTQADISSNKQSYFCIHFANGNCFMGKKCFYYHHIPSLEECLLVDNSKDIFGRVRFATHRKDKMGIGNYMQESRTLKIKDFCVPTEKENFVLAGYELIYRHFSVWGTIEDIYFLSSDNIAFIRYEHRCMAEFAKESMQNRSLDSDELISIQWATSDCFELNDAAYQELKDTLLQQEQEEEVKKSGKKNLRNPEKQRRSMKEYEQEQDEIKKLEEHFERASDDPNKKFMDVEMKQFEQRVKQQRLNEEILKRSLKKVKLSTQRDSGDFANFLKKL